MSFFDNLFRFDENNYYSVSGLNKELSIIYLYNSFIKRKKSELIVVNSLYEATSIYEGLLKYTSKVLFFPMDDFITSEAIAISPELQLERINTLSKLVSDEKYIVVTNLMGFLRYLPDKKLWKEKILKLRVGEDIKREKLINCLYDLGYEKEVIVSKSLEIAVRGYVIDIFPIGYENPIRIELWGDTIESIKYYDIDTQLSIKNVDDVIINPASEFLSDKSGDIIRKQKYLKYYNDNVSNIFEYINNCLCFYCDYNQIISSYRHLKEEVLEYKNGVIEEIDTFYMNDLEGLNIKDAIFMMGIDDFLVDVKVSKIDKYVSYNIDDYKDNIEYLKKDIISFLSRKKTVIFCLENEQLLKKMYRELEELKPILTNEKNIVSNCLNLIIKDINNGFVFNDYVIICNNDVFKREVNKSYHNSLKMGTKIKDITSIIRGDYIVHDVHGIGKYDGISTISKNGIMKDYIKLIYNGGDVLYVPANKIDRISKYISKEGYVPKLNKLGSDDFQKIKMGLRKKLEDIAGKLLKIYAERELKKGFAFSSDDENQAIFDSEFEFNETKDQLLSIEKIKNEMEKESPMDMLLCGDVGYGKTEVAFRAIFKAVNDGKQVAYLCPTTILSNQQYKSAISRFKNFPVNIALLNRFVSAKRQKQVLEDLKKGKVDILFGTHRILSNDIEFKDLGLLVIDEEQRFGVKHKEKIKEYKANVDVLTLSATPIPRTLQMSMTGIRSLALIETPPAYRYPIQTYLLPIDDKVVKDAIYKEMSRKGQVFILYNKVFDIEDKVRKIQKLVPEARIEYVHGKMNKDTLENKMIKFINYECDILICTTIIETGIDIPNVNTLIVIDADHFGLSQLYQIRGRIGRSNKIGYAYLMYNNNKMLNDTAIKRLQTIKEFTQLGSGFKIAMRDLSIRGAGDILGSEQSGFIDTVGIEMYLKMLNEEILKLKGEEVIEEKDETETKTLINVDTHIGNEYADDDTLKIFIHKKINEIDSMSKLLEIKSELEDRFGKVNKELEIYMYEEWFEKQAIKLDIIMVNDTDNYIELKIDEKVSKKIDGEKLFYYSYEISRSFKLSFVHDRIVIRLDKNKLNEHYLVYINKLLEKIIEDI